VSVRVSFEEKEMRVFFRAEEKKVLVSVREREPNNACIVSSTNEVSQNRTVENCNLL